MRKQVLAGLQNTARGAEAGLGLVGPSGPMPLAKVRVQKGNEILEIPRQDLKDAIREGFREVK